MSSSVCVLNGSFYEQGSVFTGSLPAGAERGVAVKSANPKVENLVSKNFSGGKITRKVQLVRRRIAPAVSRGQALVMGIE